MPETAMRMFDFLKLEKGTWDQIGSFTGLNGHTIGKAEILHRKLDMKDAEKWRKKFSGNAPNFGRFQIKVGQIQSVEAHSSAEHLYVLKVDIGEAQPRNIVAALVKHYTAEDLLQRKVVVLANLKPAELRGVQSEGMLLAGEHRKKMELLDGSPFEVGEIATVGDERVKWEEIEVTTFKEAPFKLESGKATFDGQPIMVNGQALEAPGMNNGKIR
jgi:methionine--tRNA ligase beta chain